MAPHVNLVTFATPDFYRQQRALIKSASRAGIAEHSIWNRSRLAKTEFFRDNQTILENTRGAGFWLWKPYIIRREIEAAKSGDFVLYYDVGRPLQQNRITRSLLPLLQWCLQNNEGMFPGVYIPEHGRNAKWTKRECFVIMNCDEPKYWDHPQIQATFSVWQRNSQSVRILDEWLGWCTTPGVISDDAAFPNISNFADFVDHRHDQSVLTNVAIRNGLHCYGAPEVPILESRDVDAAKDINIVVSVIAGDRRGAERILVRRSIERYLRDALLKIKKLWRFSRRK